MVVVGRGSIAMKQFGKQNTQVRIDRIWRIALRWRQAAEKIQSGLLAIMSARTVSWPVSELQNRSNNFSVIVPQTLRTELLRQDRLMRLVIAAYGRDIGQISSIEGRALSSQQDLTQIAKQLVHLDQKAAALRDSVARVLALNSDLERQLKQACIQTARLDQARLAALAWSDTLRAELDRKSEALRLANAELATRTADLSSASANPQPS